jgi:hypothetical protein
MVKKASQTHSNYSLLSQKKKARFKSVISQLAGLSFAWNQRGNRFLRGLPVTSLSANLLQISREFPPQLQSPEAAFLFLDHCYSICL